MQLLRCMMFAASALLAQSFVLPSTALALDEPTAISSPVVQTHESNAEGIAQPVRPVSNALWSLFQLLFALLFIVALVYLTLHKGLGTWLRKSQANKLIQVKERMVLDSKRSLYIVEVSGKVMLLGGGDNGVTL